MNTIEYVKDEAARQGMTMDELAERTRFEMTGALIAVELAAAHTTHDDDDDAAIAAVGDAVTGIVDALAGHASRLLFGKDDRRFEIRGEIEVCILEKAE